MMALFLPFELLMLIWCMQLVNGKVIVHVCTYILLYIIMHLHKYINMYDVYL